LPSEFTARGIFFKEKKMRKVESYVSRRLIIGCLLMVGCAGLSFGGGSMQAAGGGGGGDAGAPVTKATRTTNTLDATRATRATRATETAETAEAAEVSEVKDADFVPRRNPAAGQASSTVYAIPAVALKPEVAEERLPPPVYAISGVRNQEIRENTPQEVVDIVIELPAKRAFSQGLVEGAYVSDWISNLPAGLEGRAHNVKQGATSIRIYVAGTPTIAVREEIRVTIPGTFLTGGTALQFFSPSETESLSAWEASQTAAQ
jgi:hypothetical protein